MSARPVLVAVCVLLFACATGNAHAAAQRTLPFHRLTRPLASVRHDAEVSGNWSGYAVTGQSFADVKGSWVVPAVDCSTATSDTYSSSWIGLGGFLSAQALEQDGTDSFCWDGQPVYDAWYEVVPAPPVTVRLTVAAGDTIAADVSVNGGQTLMTLTDMTTGQTFTQAVPFATPDVSAAEWIEEAPADCDPQLTSCRVLPLANFGAMTFTSAQATTVDGHSGTITDQSWQPTAIVLAQDDTGDYAVPSLLTADGSSFAVAFETGTPSVPPTPALPPAATPPATPPPTTSTPPSVAPKATPKPKPAKPKAKQKLKRKPAKAKASHKKAVAHSGG